MKKYSTKTFIEKAMKIHNDYYDYSLVNYISSKNNVLIICSKHGMFEQRPDHHLSGSGCPYCSNNKKYEKDILERFRKKHKNKYDYSITKILNAKQKIKYICPTHGIIEQYISNHYKYGCYKCAKNKKLTFKELIEKFNEVHGEYEYENFEYENVKQIINIKCSKHGFFKQRINNHLQGQGCPSCGNIKRRLKRIKQIEKNKFDNNQVVPSFNSKACELFDKISEKNNIKIQHAMNGGEFYIKELGYFVDGYDKENNVVYEFDEKYHKYQKEKDKIREKEITDFLKCKFIRISV